MNLREQIEKEITDKVMTKLASEKVELSLVGDLAKAESNYRKAINSLDKQIETFYNAIFKARDLGKKINDSAYLSEIKNAEKILKETETLAKNFGISPNSIDEYNNLKSSINTSDDMKDEIKVAKNQLNKLTI
jgi:predicted ribosome quality control (RQC) complex YloA/Tae2 family protein